ncbi:MAG: hypothetical protein QOF79_232 [Actinomycetota bacterium]|jgi:hypothetical protein|nr:hypothetical protein [Actinomycetota bacterium]
MSRTRSARVAVVYNPTKVGEEIEVDQNLAWSTPCARQRRGGIVADYDPGRRSAGAMDPAPH